MLSTLAQVARPRLRVRSLLVVVALVALGLGIWNEWFSPSRLWVRALHDNDDGMRRWGAVSSASWQKDPAARDWALGQLVRALEDPGFRVRWDAALGLERMGTKAVAAVPALLRALNDPNFRVRAAAASALGAVVSPNDDARNRDVVPALAAALDDRQRIVRLRSGLSLAALGEHEAALPALIEELRSHDIVELHRVLYALSKMNATASPATPELIALARGNPDHAAEPLMRGCRVYACDVLLRLGERQEALDALLALANDPDASVSAEAQKVLMKWVPSSVRGTATSQ